MNTINPQDYFTHQGFDDLWFSNSKPCQILILIINEKYDLHSNMFKKNDCHTILSFLRHELRKSQKREKLLNKNNKKGIGLIKVKKTEIQNRECVICFENPDFSNLITTNCKHNFCKDCYTKWETKSVQINYNRNITCPYCRKDNPKIIGYIVK